MEGKAAATHNAGITRQTWKRGVGEGLKTSWFILRIMIPVYALMTILGHTPVISWFSKAFEPLMKLVGLPGGAAIAFVTGALVNVYAAMGIILALDMAPWQITIMAVMLNLSHELPVESAVLKSAGVNPWPILLIRLIGAFVVAAFLHLLGLFLGLA
jgi:Fe2+ transport system protein B